MSATSGEWYRIREGRGRPLWAFGPEPPSKHGQRDDFIHTSVPDGALVMYVEECRDRHDQLQWVKVVYGEHIGYLQCQFLSVGSLLDPEPAMEGQVGFRYRQDQKSVGQ